MKYAKVELHLHLDGSLNLKWVYDRALLRGVVDSTTTFSEFYKLMHPCFNDYNSSMFNKFNIVCDCLQTREDLFEAAYHLVKELDEMGLIYAEIRFASQLHIKKGLNQLEALKAVIDGANKAQEECPIKVNIINAMMHKGDSANCNYQENLDTIEATKEMLNKGCVALDIAGYENNCEFNDYAPLFEIARKYEIPFTIHAGEMGNGEHILDAIKMKPKRIGHGINCVQKQEYIDALISNDIPLEICVTSNVEPKYNYADHPIRQIIDSGVKVTINSDNMMFSRTNVINEYFLIKQLGIDDEKLKQCCLNSIDYAFIDDKTKEELKKKIDI